MVVSLHQVDMAMRFCTRVVALRDGEVVYDGPPDGLTPEVLTEIYGAEDWTQTIRPADDDEADGDAGEDAETPEQHAVRLDRERLAGIG